MPRHGASGQPVKGQRTNKPKAAKTPSARVSTTDLQEQVAALTRELTEARDELTEAFEYQTATGEVLNVISRSPSDVQPVFDMIAESAARLCEGQFCFVYRFDGQLLHFVAHHSLTPEVLEMNRRAYPAPPSRRSAAARAILERGFVQIPDINADPDYVLGAQAMVGHYRSVVGVPILRDGVPIGAIAVARAQAGLLPDRQVELLKTFADQAVIAIENVRLFDEVQARTRDLSESLEQQTATSEVLKVVSSSPGNLEPVFDAMLQNAVRICGAKFGNLMLREGDAFRVGATHGAPQAYVDYLHNNQMFRTNPGLAQLVKTKEHYHLVDIAAAPTFGDELREATVHLAGARTLIGVPMLKDDIVIGAIIIYRQEVRPFTNKQIELVKNFAAQAVIAIENTRLLNELRQRTDDLSESLEQQTATSEVLKVISSSPGKLEPAFNSMLENATRLCEAKFGTMYLYEGGAYRAVATHNAPAAYAELRKRNPTLRPPPDVPLGRIVTTKEPVQIADIKTTQSYIEGDPFVVAAVDGAGYRTVLAVPMLKKYDLIGAIVIQRQEVRLFNNRQVELISNFASQAVVAIENARLLSELRKSLQQQTATADVLKVISSSPGELDPVFQALLENAVRICGAKFGNLFLREDDALRVVALHGAPQAYVEERQRNPVIRPGPKTTLGRAMTTKQPVQIADIQNYKPDSSDDTGAGTTGVKLVKLAGARTVLAVPMVKESELVGAIVIYRQEVRPFTDKQVELVQNFAAQAVIAIENTRLLNELRESLQQQTATADVLTVISSSPGDLEPVFDALLTNAMQVCDAKFGFMYRASDTDMKIMAHKCDVPAYLEFAQKARFTPQTIVGRVAETKQVIQVVDIAATQRYADREPLAVAAVEIGRVRTILGVPLLKENEVKGAILLYRQEVRPFTDKQIELVKHFAAQAVIAIENTRLLSELRESLQQQTATADVLKVISRSTFNLRTVLDTLVKSAVRLCRAEKGNVALLRDTTIEYLAQDGFPPDFLEYMKALHLKVQRGSVSGRAALEGKIIHVPDVLADPEFVLLDAQKVGGFRTALGVPLMREGIPVGTMFLARAMVEPFTQQQIDLVSTFADQAVIAIENVRLFESVEARTRELAKSLEELRTTQDRLVQTQKLALLGQLTAGIAHEIKNPLNFVNNFSGISAELIGELQDTLKGMPLDDKARTEINDLTDTLKSNFDKVVHHGRRADAIVKNMLQHSREGSGEHRVIDINALVEESLNLAWHGARAETQGFEVKLKQSFDPSAGGADVFPQDIRRALLNLIANGFYAATRRRAETNGGDYEPTLTASTRNLGDRVEVSIRDNGTGIAPDVKEKMFEPFFTTKPTGEGTGLGLSISHDVIVKQHAGTIEVDTQPGAFTEIRIVLPRTPAFV